MPRQGRKRVLHPVTHLQRCFWHKGLGWREGATGCTCEDIRKLWLRFILSPACPKGFYRTDVSTPHCLKCPLHSTTQSEGATICTCENGHYRAPGEDPQMACTRESMGQGTATLEEMPDLCWPSLGSEFSGACQILETARVSGTC